MRSDNKVIQALWIGDKLSTMELLCIKSFLANGHDFHLYTYFSIKNVPDGVVLLDGQRVLSREQIFKYRGHNSYAGFSNRFRYKLLMEKGGIWVDTDVVCLRPFCIQEDELIASEFVKPERSCPKKRLKTANCVMKTQSGSSLAAQCFNEAMKADPRTMKWGETGPKLTQRIVRENSLKGIMAQPSDFCMIDYWNVGHLVSRDPIRNTYMKAKLKFKKPYALHLWNEMWKRNGLDKDGIYSAGCLYESLKKRYL